VDPYFISQGPLIYLIMALGKGICTRIAGSKNEKAKFGHKQFQKMLSIKK